MDDFIDDFAKQYGIKALGGLDKPDVQLAYKIGVMREARENGQKIHQTPTEKLREKITAPGLGCGPEYKGQSTTVVALDDLWAIACLIDSLDVAPPNTRKWS